MTRVAFALGSILLQCFLLIGVDAQNGGLEDVEIAEDCRTPNNGTGVCILIHQCSPLLAIIRHRPLPQSSLNFLLTSLCGFINLVPKVCCPPINNGYNNNRNANGNAEINVNLRNNPLLPEDCGRPDLSSRITGGEVTKLDEFPWLALLEYRKPTGTTTACGGVLINRRYVMTAAHCIKGTDLPETWTLIRVRLGEYDTSTDRDCVENGDNNQVCAADPVTIEIEEQIAHEQYNPNFGVQPNDVALLRLKRDVDFTNYIKPICLPTNVSFPQELYVAGWGKTETKRASNVKLKLALSIADYDICKQKYENEGVNLGDGQICAGGQRGKGSCRGDSGSPLMTVETTPDGADRWTAVGILSFGSSRCGMQGSPSVYTKVIDFVPWALNKMRP